MNYQLKLLFWCWSHDDKSKHFSWHCAHESKLALFCPERLPIADFYNTYGHYYLIDIILMQKNCITIIYVSIYNKITRWSYHHNANARIYQLNNIIYSFYTRHFCISSMSKLQFRPINLFRCLFNLFSFIVYIQWECTICIQVNWNGVHQFYSVQVIANSNWSGRALIRYTHKYTTEWALLVDSPFYLGKWAVVVVVVVVATVCGYFSHWINIAQ